MSPEDYPEFMQYLEEVVQAIKSPKDWEKVAEHKVGLALETLSHGQQIGGNRSTTFVCRSTNKWKDIQ
jgi:hypothetical protein